MSSATGHVSRSGTSAIISQVVADAGMSVKPVAGHQANQRKGRSCWVSRRLAEKSDRFLVSNQYQRSKVLRWGKGAECCEQ